MCSFFGERDCATLVRPLTSEDDLQRLEKFSLEQLRPEFLEQLSALRSKIMHSLKPKMLNNQVLSGEMLLTLCRNYTETINSGGIPNI